MSVQKLIEKFGNENTILNVHLKQFAIELLEMIEPNGAQVRHADGDPSKALGANYWKALEELRK